MSDAENTTREKVMLTVREKAHRAVSSVLFNASNYPERVQARILGQDTQPLTEKVVDALIAAFPTLTATTDPDDEQAWIEYMSTDDFLQLIPTPGSMFRAGYRAALAAVSGGNA